MRMILIGPPGAGKGTQVTLIQNYYQKHFDQSMPQISTGDELRAAVRNHTAEGMKAKSYMDAGRLVPDEIIIPILMERILQPDCASGYILDGFPRNLAQAEKLDSVSDRVGTIEAVTYIDVPDTEIVRRLVNRRVCPQCKRGYNLLFQKPRSPGICDEDGTPLVQRDDDNEGTIRNRLAVFHHQTQPLLDFYKKRGILYRIDGAPSAHVVSTALEALLQQLSPSEKAP
ncbi:MAG: adenylate kinase [Nanoarchaeota archaeon]